MGTKQSSQRCSDSSTEAQADARSWNDSEFGTYVKVTISPRTPRESSGSSTTTSTASRQNSLSSTEREQVVPEAARLLTQSHSEQQESQIRNVAPWLLHTTTGFEPPAKYAEVSPLNPRDRATEAIIPSRAMASLYSSMTPELSPSEAKRRKRVIAKSLVLHMHELVEQVRPDEVAGKLYGIGILDVPECHRAADKSRCENERAMELVQLIKWKLWRSPEWFVDISKILRNCSVKVVSKIIDEVNNECPAEEMSMLSSGSRSIAPKSTSLKPICDLSYHDMLKKIEASYNESGRQAAAVRILKYTADQGVDIELVNQACQREVAVSTLELLLDVLTEKGDNSITNTKAECGRTPLHEACAALVFCPSPDQDHTLEGNSMQRKKLEILLKYGANNCIKDKDGNTPLHLAALRSDCEAVKILLRSGGRRCINIVNKCGNTALHIACRRGRLDLVTILCSHRANTSTPNNKNKTVLHLACVHNHIDTALYLAAHDQSTLDGLDRNHRTPLHICCKRAHSLLALSLLKLKNCTVFKLDKDNKTPLHFAVAMENIGLVTALLQKEAGNLKDSSRGLMVNVQDKYGDTALHIASRLGNKPIAKQLLNFKVDDSLMNQEGKTALEVAVESENCQIPKKMLRKRGWHQRRKISRRIKLRRTLTQSTLTSSVYQQSEVSELNDNSSSESEEDENYQNNERRGTY